MKNHSEIRFDVVHTCSDFEGAQRWAKNHSPPPGIMTVDHLNHTLESKYLPTYEQLVEAGWESD